MPQCGNRLLSLFGSETGPAVMPWIITAAGGEELQSPRPAMIPPPRQTSPSYNTADCPGVTAH
jgi:hypothetical protein